MATVTLKWSGPPPCGSTSPPYPGQTYNLYLDPNQFEASVPTLIVGTFVSEGSGGTGYERTYTFTVEDDDVPEEVTKLCSVHFLDIGCMDNCCDQLTGRVLVLENRWKVTEAPPDPVAGEVIPFVEDNGAGKLRLMLQFPTGAAVQIGIEP